MFGEKNTVAVKDKQAYLDSNFQKHEPVYEN